MEPAPVVQERPPERRHGFALALAVAGLLLAWVPGLGLLLSLAAVGTALWARRRGLQPGAWAVRLGALAAVLAAGFTGAYLACSPGRDAGEARERWEAFDRAFDAPAKGAREP